MTWFTNHDLWRDWCELQTPYPVLVDGRQQYACIEDARPQGEVLGSVDGKDWLCSSTDSVCRCDAEGCVMETAAAVRTLDLAFEGDRLYGVLMLHDSESDRTAYLFDLQVDGDAMEGLLSNFVWAEEPPIELRMRRVE